MTVGDMSEGDWVPYSDTLVSQTSSLTHSLPPILSIRSLSPPIPSPPPHSLSLLFSLSAPSFPSPLSLYPHSDFTTRLRERIDWGESPLSNQSLPFPISPRPFPFNLSHTHS